ncbi:MAG: universal stress protein [Salinirussus sp.]
MAFERVLLAIGPDDRDRLDTLMDATVDVAEPADATVYLVYVFPRSDYEDVLLGMDIDTAAEGASPDEVARRHESARQPADRLTSLDLDYGIRGVVGGDSAEQVLRKVDQLDADVVVVGGTRRSPAGKAVFGDHPQQILLNAPVPVLYVGRE